VNGLETFILDMSQAVGLVPSSRKNVKGDLTANGVGQVKVREFRLKILHEFGTDASGEIVLFKLVTLWVTVYMPCLALLHRQMAIESHTCSFGQWETH
jgi:hypothetical protein